MMMQKLQEIHHMSGELLQMMGQMGQREGYPMNMREGGGQYSQGGNGGGQGGSGGQRMPQYLDPWMY